MKYGRSNCASLLVCGALATSCAGGQSGTSNESSASTNDDADPNGHDGNGATDGEGGSTLGAAALGSCATPQPGAAPLRRLSNAEYTNTMVDLIGNEQAVREAAASFPREPTSLGFRNAAHALTITPLIADEYVNAANTLAEIAIDDGDVLPCTLSSVNATCVQRYVQGFGKRVYRRPVAEGELRRYSDLYNTVLDETGSAREALVWITTALFSSSHFLFRVEISQPPTGDVARPVGYEMASRLSYLLWQTMPDDELFAAAESGELLAREGVANQVKRMAGDPRALRMYEFFEQWLDLDEADALARAPESYPSFDAALVELFQAENRAFVYDILMGNGTFGDLLAADYTFANQALAEHYGLDPTPLGNTFEKVEAEGRAGILTQATLLIHDRPARTSIVKRGVKLRTDFLCQIVPAPPATVNATLPELDGEMTQRERLQKHRTDPSCAGCHSLIDPLGEIFEGFDALGRPRTTDEAGASIVTGGSVSNTATLDGDYAAPRELATAMAQSPEVRECFALQAFRFFYGRDATSEDACTRQQLMNAFQQNDYRIVDLLIGLTQSDQFLYKRRTEVEQ